VKTSSLARENLFVKILAETSLKRKLQQQCGIRRETCNITERAQLKLKQSMTKKEEPDTKKRRKK
jgi:hypothetical protein